MEKEHLTYTDNLENINEFYNNIIQRSFKLNDIFDILYLEKMMQFVVKDGKLDFDTIIKLNEKIELVYDEKVSFEISNEIEKTKILEDKKDITSNKLSRLREFKQFLDEKVLIESRAKYNVESKKGMPKERETLLKFIDEEIDDINTSFNDYVESEPKVKTL